MVFGREESAERALERIRGGIKEFENVLSVKEQRLSELFSSLKQDILSSENLHLEHIRVLEKQVKHILSVARAIHFPALEKAFEEEESILAELRELFEEYPRLNASESADVQAALRNLRSMIASQQEMIFRHKEILSQEKRRLVQILQEASSLEQELVSEHKLAAKNPRLLH